MTPSANWDARVVLATFGLKPWNGHAWRAHWRSYEATDHGGSLRFSGRYHRGPDDFPEDQSWGALYLALSPEVALGEIFRQLSPELMHRLNGYRLSELDVELNSVVDCRNAEALGLTPDDFMRDYDFTLTQGMGAAAMALGVEAIVVQSATRLGDNLVVFPTQLQSTSKLVVVNTRDPRLYVPR